MPSTPDTEWVDPCAQRVIDRCGGIKAVADATGLHPSGLYRWTRPRSKLGTGGLIPAPSRTLIIEAMKAGRLPITYDDLREGLEA